MEELKSLYKQLEQIDDEEERYKVWAKILQKNRLLLKKKMEKVNLILGEKAEILKDLTKNLKEQETLLKDLKEKRKPEKNI